MGDRMYSKLKIKQAFKNALTYGLALEVIAVSTGYFLYKEYRSNQEFREMVEDQFPQLTEAYNAVSGVYLKAMPKRLRDKILENDDNGSSTSSSNQTNPTPSTDQK